MIHSRRLILILVAVAVLGLAGVARGTSHIGDPMKSDLAMTKELVGNLVPGQNATYQLIVSEVGGGIALGPITVTDDLGPGLTFVSATGSGWTCTAAGQSVTCTLSQSLYAGGSLPAITLTVLVAKDATEVENCATVLTQPTAAWPGDVNPANDRACVTTPVSGAGFDLAIKKELKGTCEAGAPCTEVITITNNGPGTFSGNLNVTINYNAPVTLQGWQPPGSWSCTPQGTASSFNCTTTSAFIVPPNGSLALTLTFIAEAGSYNNCVSLNIDDLNASNNRSCIDFPVNPSGGEPGAICGVKFHDLNGNGAQDANEPGLSGWTIQIKDASGNLVTAVITGRGGKYCFRNLKPGIYSVSEVLQPGWVQTAPQPVPPGTATVTVAAGQTVSVFFGNRSRKEPCCLDFTFTGGRADNFNTFAGPEPAVPPPGAQQAYFDETAIDKRFDHRIGLPAGNCIREATLEIRVKPLPSTLSINDTLTLKAGPGYWSAYFGTFTSPAGLLPNEWRTGNYGSGQTFALDLANLPGGGNLLPALNSTRYLDIGIQDDTSVDYLKLTVRFCECEGEEAPDVSISAARELKLFIGQKRRVVEGVEDEIGVAPVVREGRTFLPIRYIEPLGAEISWDAAERKVTVVLGERQVELWVDNPLARWTSTWGEIWVTTSIDPDNPAVQPYIDNGRVMLPLRFVVESLGLEVDFQGIDQPLTIRKGPGRTSYQP